MLTFLQNSINDFFLGGGRTPVPHPPHRPHGLRHRDQHPAHHQGKDDISKDSLTLILKIYDEHALILHFKVL